LQLPADGSHADLQGAEFFEGEASMTSVPRSARLGRAVVGEILAAPAPG